MTEMIGADKARRVARMAGLPEELWKKINDEITMAAEDGRFSVTLDASKYSEIQNYRIVRTLREKGFVVVENEALCEIEVNW